MASPSRQRVALAARLSQVEQLGRRVRLDHGLVGDIGDTLRALVPKLSEHSDDRHLKAALEHYRKARKDLDELAVGEPGKKPIHPQYLARVLNEVAAPNGRRRSGPARQT